MLTKLRRKFILINMGLVCVVLTIVFSAVCLSRYQSLQRAGTETISRMLFTPDAEKLSKFELGKPDLPQDRRRAENAGFIVDVDESGSYRVRMEGNASVSDETVAEAVKLVRQRGDRSGKLNEYALRYGVLEQNGNVIIAFADVSSDAQAMRELIFYCLLAMTLGLVAFFFISLFLGNWALAPVERAWTEQNRFVADASHELKTPLTVILANLGILLSHPGETVESQRKWVENTRHESLRMKSLVEDLLYLAKTDSLEHARAYERVNLSDVVWNSLLTFESVAFEKNVTCLDCIAANVYTTGNGGELFRLCGVLLDNAMKYAGDGGNVRVTLERCQDRCVLSVTNGGPPIPPEDLPHIFERFFRADKARSEGGSGLGLSIAKRIVEAHSGSIHVTSSERTGSVFTVTLPSS